VIPNPCVASSALRSPMNVDVLSKRVALANRQKRLFAVVLEVLGLDADHAERKEAVVTVDRRGPFNDDMGIQNTPVADNYFFADPAEGADGDTLPKTR